MAWALWGGQEKCGQKQQWWRWKGNWQACALGQKEESRRDNREPMCGCLSLTSISLRSHFSLELTFMPPIVFSVFHPAPWSFDKPVLGMLDCEGIGGDLPLLTMVDGEMCSWNLT